MVKYITLLDLDLPWDLEVEPQLPYGAVSTETIAEWPVKSAGQEFQFIEVTQVGVADWVRPGRATDLWSRWTLWRGSGLALRPRSGRS